MKKQHPNIQRTSAKKKTIKLSGKFHEPAWFIYCQTPSGRHLLLVSVDPVQWAQRVENAYNYGDPEALVAPLRILEKTPAFRNTRAMSLAEWQRLTGDTTTPESSAQ